MNELLLKIMAWAQSERGDVTHIGGVGLILLVIIILYLTERAGVTNIFD